MRYLVIILVLLVASLATAQTQDSVEVRAYRLTMPDTHRDIILDAAAQWRVCPFLLYALLDIESGLDCSKVNPKSKAAGCGQFTRRGVWGLNNIREARGAGRTFRREHAFDPQKGIHATAEVLGWLIRQYGLRVAVTSYNGGKHRRWFAWEVLRRADRYRTRAALPALPYGRHKRSQAASRGRPPVT